MPTRLLVDFCAYQCPIMAICYYQGDVTTVTRQNAQHDFLPAAVAVAKRDLVEPVRC
jgi:hypothetical protein